MKKIDICEASEIVQAMKIEHTVDIGVAIAHRGVHPIMGEVTVISTMTGYGLLIA